MGLVRVIKRLIISNLIIIIMVRVIRIILIQVISMRGLDGLWVLHAQRVVGVREQHELGRGDGYRRRWEVMVACGCVPSRRNTTNRAGTGTGSTDRRTKDLFEAVVFLEAHKDGLGRDVQGLLAECVPWVRGCVH